MNRNKQIFKETLFILGVFLLGLTYNLFFLPNNLVIGGTTGLSIIFKNKINPQIFIYIFTLLLLSLSYFVLGKESSKKTLFGSLLYPLCVTLSGPLAKLLLTYLTFNNMFATAITAAVFYGVSNGIIFRTGYDTGGFDVVAKIITKYLKIPQGKSLFYANILVIVAGSFAFGIRTAQNAAIVLYIGSIITNKIVIGVSESKVFFIYTDKVDKVTKIIVDKLKCGYTLLPTIGGYSHKKSELIMCVLPTRDYMLLKELVLNVDDDAFIVVNDCYDVNGGFQKNNILPF